MKKIIAVLLTLAMLLSLAACGGSAEEDPNAGKYIGISAAVGGFSMPMSDIYPGETWIELKSGGKGSIALDGDSYSMKWALEGESITITLEGVDSVGTLKDNAIVVDLMDMGCVMTFRKEGTEPAETEAPAASYNDAGYWDLIRIDGATEEDSVSEEDMELVKSMGMYMYLELLPDGTGTFFVEEEMAVTWVDGTVNFTEDNMSVNYTLENGEMTLDMIESVLVFRKGEKPEPVVSEMEAAGFTDFMEVGVPYAYTTKCYNDETKTTTGELTVTSYEIFEEAEGYAPLEGYEWRVVKMEARFYDENTGKYGMSVSTQREDYYNVKLHDDTIELVEETEEYDQYCHTVIHNGEEMDAYTFITKYYGDWYTGEAGNDEVVYYCQWDFLVPIGYDGCVAGMYNTSLDWLDGTYITDYDPSYFLLFRADNESATYVTDGAADDGGIAGTYSLYALEDSGEYIDNATLVSLEMDGLVVVTFNGDGTGVMSTEGEKVAFTYDDTTMSDEQGFTYGYVLEEGMLKVDVGEGQIFHCKKQ